MDSSVGQESLVQRGRSPLFLSLIGLFEEADDALRNAPDEDFSTYREIFKRIALKDRMQVLIKEKTNISLSGIYFVKSDEPNATLVAGLTGKASKRVASGKDTLASIAAKLKDSYLDKEGVLDEGYDKSAFIFSLLIYIGLWVKKKDGSFLFSAEEKAAIILHEIGHVFDYVENYFYVSYRVTDTSDIINYVKQNPDLNTVLAIIEQLEESIALEKQWRTVLVNLKKRVTTYTSDANLTTADLESLNTLVVVLMNHCATVSLKRFGQIQIAKTPFNVGLLGTTNTSARSSYVNAERLADEFAVRNGSLVPFQSAIIKLDQVARHVEKHIRQQYRYDFDFIKIRMLRLFEEEFTLNAEILSSRYDPIVRRVALNIETVKHAFSEEALDPEISSFLKEEIKISEQYLRKLSSSESKREKEELKRWVSQVIRFGRIIKIPFENRIFKDYAKLQDATRSLTRNPFYYIAKS